MAHIPSIHQALLLGTGALTSCSRIRNKPVPLGTLAYVDVENLWLRDLRMVTRARGHPASNQRAAIFAVQAVALRVENPLLMLGWAVGGSLIPLDTPGIAVLESFAKRAFVSILC
jgi:hypothetical protein